MHGTGGLRRRVGSKVKRSGHPHAHVYCIKGGTMSLCGRDAHSRDGSHVLEGNSRCQNLQGRAHLSQLAAASRRWSVRLDQHQDKLDYTPTM